MGTQDSRTLLANCGDVGTDTLLHPSGDLVAEPLKQPWRRRGWITEIEEWFVGAMREQALRMCRGGSLVQWRNMHYSTIFRCEMESTDRCTSACNPFEVYLKSSCSNFSEAKITKAVASHFPDIVPKVLVTRDDCTFVQAHTYDSNNVSEHKIVKVIADMQVRSVDSIESLRAAGVPYRGLDWHARQVVEVLDHPIVKSLQGKDFYRSLRDHIRDFQTLLAELASYNIPRALVHGDFNFENVRADSSKQESPRFIDWATACIGYPLLDFFRISKIEFDGIRERGATDIYLSAWKRFEVDENIERALQLTEPVLVSDNLHTILKQCEAANAVERPDVLVHLGSCIEGLSESISTCLRNRNSNCEVSSGTGYIIIAKDGGRRILTLAEESKGMLSLPVVTAFGITRITDRVLDGHGMHQMIKAQLGINTRAVRGLWERAPSGQLRKIAMVLEALDAEHNIVPGHTWRSESDIKAFRNCRTEDQSVVEAFFSGIGAQETISVRTPWREFGWLMCTKGLLDAALRRVGLEVVGGLYEMKTNAFSTVWKCCVRDTTKGDSHERGEDSQSVYLKSSMFDMSEGRLLSIMSSFACGLVPSVVEIDLPSNMFVMTDVGRIEENDIDLSLALKGLGSLQKSSIAYIDQLHEAGLPEYKCSWVKQNTKRLLEQSRLIAQEQDKDETVSKVIDAGDIIQCVEELDLLGVPLTLVHGDFHNGNTASKVTDGHRIFDWSSAFIGHPFADIAVIVRTSGSLRDEDTAVEEYLRLWKGIINEAKFGKAIGQAFVYYWMVNLESLLQQIQIVPVADHFFIKDRIVWSLRHLSSAVGAFRKC